MKKWYVYVIFGCMWVCIDECFHHLEYSWFHSIIYKCLFLASKFHEKKTQGVISGSQNLTSTSLHTHTQIAKFFVLLVLNRKKSSLAFHSIKQRERCRERERERYKKLFFFIIEKSWFHPFFLFRFFSIATYGIIHNDDDDNKMNASLIIIIIIIEILPFENVCMCCMCAFLASSRRSFFCDSQKTEIHHFIHSLCSYWREPKWNGKKRVNKKFFMQQQQEEKLTFVQKKRGFRR